MVYVNSDLVIKYSKQIFELLCACDTEFTPPLSTRCIDEKDCTDDNINTIIKLGDKTHTPLNYFNFLIKNHFVLALSGDKLVGFSAFKPNTLVDNNTTQERCNYVIMTCINPDYRGKGVGNALYRFFDSNLLTIVGCPIIMRRTWSTNEKQKHLYKKFGYELTKTIPNHRSEGVHSLYYSKSLTNEG